ncbi:hypothetical protein CCAX7_49760 [Capsulimonas corticalis]|uniref:Uncharacterized protein n=1 Tax=Capsulimonas corticalis TaxID=2219043 RepID=A0A402CPZ6_9BACT|nr:hypothetical protein [Capsulimonas corticalis]BDI32925.1 hypothetical protein CCAX7_49760 [Capsulimonas corticalis]
MSALISPLDEARENLRVIRQTMERSTQYSTLSGWSGVLIGLIALAATAATQRVVDMRHAGGHLAAGAMPTLAGIWLAALILAVSAEFLCNKIRARRVGKHIVSRLGAHVAVASLPAFLGGAILTAFFSMHGLALHICGIWMLCYGLAICAVGLFSAKPVTFLGSAFVLAGAVTLLLPLTLQLPMMAIAFGGFHIIYGVVIARRHGW